MGYTVYPHCFALLIGWNIVEWCLISGFRGTLSSLPLRWRKTVQTHSKTINNWLFQEPNTHQGTPRTSCDATPVVSVVSPSATSSWLQRSTPFETFGKRPCALKPSVHNFPPNLGMKCEFPVTQEERLIQCSGWWKTANVSRMFARNVETSTNLLFSLGQRATSTCFSVSHIPGTASVHRASPQRLAPGRHTASSGPVFSSWTRTMGMGSPTPATVMLVGR